MSTVVLTTEACDGVCDYSCVSGNTELLNCVENNKTCDHSWLTKILENTPLMNYTGMRKLANHNRGHMHIELLKIQ